MSTNTQGGYRIGTVKGRKLSEDRAMTPDLIDRAALRAAVTMTFPEDRHPVILALIDAAPRAATDLDWERLYVEESERYVRLSNQMTRERLAAALYEALNGTRVGPDYPESLALADTLLAALATQGET